LLFNPSGALLLFDETTNSVMVLDTVGYLFNVFPVNIQLVNTSAGWKLISQVDSIYGGWGVLITKIYSLPGSYPPQPVIVKENHTGTELANPYPNPTNKQITLPYQLPKGQSGTLTIYNMEGKVIKTYTIDSMFHDIILNASELPKGMYLYSVESNGQKLGTKKFPVKFAILKKNAGILNDAHFNTKRPVSLLSWDDVISWKKKCKNKFKLNYGDFAENITLSGFSLKKITLNTIVVVNKKIKLKIIQIGKKCHSDCEIKKTVGNCIMPKYGVFAKVLSGGKIDVGNTIFIKN
jgi:hypothetical protein